MKGIGILESCRDGGRRRRNLRWSYYRDCHETMFHVYFTSIKESSDFIKSSLHIVGPVG